VSADEVKRIDAQALKAQLHDGGEQALLDAREELPFRPAPSVDRVVCSAKPIGAAGRRSGAAARCARHSGATMAKGWRRALPRGCRSSAIRMSVCWMAESPRGKRRCAITNQRRRAQQDRVAEGRHHGLTSGRPRGRPRGRREDRPKSARTGCGLRGRCASGRPLRHRAHRYRAPRRRSAPSTCWTPARWRNTRLGICAVHAWRQAGSSCRKPTRIWRPAGARVVLVDDNGVRATMTASWLKQMGWPDVAVLVAGPADGDWVIRRHVPLVLGLEATSVPAIDAMDLRDRLAAGEVAVIDLDQSRRYALGHIPGAWFANRSRLGPTLANLPTDQIIVLTIDGWRAGGAGGDRAADRRVGTGDDSDGGHAGLDPGGIAARDR
jgi:hypothetical protein